MLISIDWIKDFAKVPDIDPKDIYTKFTLTTAEVENVIEVNNHLEKIVVAEIVSFEKHPEADKLNLVTFKISQADVRKVVCGASNVKVGIKVPFAPLGVKLPNGLLLEAKKIRGILSEGMLCSEEELGFVDKSEGLLELSSNAIIGMNMLEYFKLKKDIIFDIDNKSLTHRPDLWGHYGMAREFSAMFDLNLANPFDSIWSSRIKSYFTDSPSPIVPRFQNESAGISYFGISLDGVTVSESPNWLKSRLNSCGIRSINNIVDISNYVMLELGFPLHIFDREKIVGNEVVIQELGTEASFTTLDGIDRKLISSDTVISDATGPLVLAGIMGGLKSGVSSETTKVFIEVANWKSALVRKTSTRLGLRTDSSQRFEKSLDSFLAERTMLRTIELIIQLCPNAKVLGKAEYAGRDLTKLNSPQIQTTFDKISKVLGKEISNERILKILDSLEFKSVVSGNSLIVTTPTFRATKDIEQEADLIEEVGRIIGYDNISPISPLDMVVPVKLTEFQKIQRRVRDFMVMQGKSFEVMTYPLVGSALLQKVSWPHNSDLKLINSLSIDHNLMRPSLIPSALEACELNAKNFDRFRFFELGRSYESDSASFCKEFHHLSIAFFDKDTNPFHDLCNVTTNLLSSLNLSIELSEKNDKFPSTLVPKSWIGLHPFEYYNIKLMGKNAGIIFSVHPLVLRNLKIKGNLSVCVFDLSLFESFKPKDKVKYRPLSKFPSSTFDWTVVIPQDIPAINAVNAAKKAKIKELQSIEILDVYHNNSMKYVTIRATLADESGTLTSELLKASELALVNATGNAGFTLK